MSYTPRKKVSLKIKKEARKLFESGFNMFDIAIELKLNLQTLYNISSKEKWEKGKLEELLYIKEQEGFTENIAVVKEERKKTYRVLTKGITDIVSKTQTDIQDGTVKLNVNENIALMSQAKALQTNYQLEKELYGLKTPEEEVDLEVKKIKLEQLKRTLEKTGEGSERTVLLDY